MRQCVCWLRHPIYYLMFNLGELLNGKNGEIRRYILVGCTCTLTDLCIYWLLLHLLEPSPSKALSFCLATGVNYLLQKYYTFKRKEVCHYEMIRFFSLYGTTLCANVLVNRICIFSVPSFLPILDNHTIRYAFAFLCATGTSTILNYLGQKFWVFKGKPATTTT